MTWWPDVPEFDHEDPPPRPVFGDLEKLDHAAEPGLPCKFRCDIGQGGLEQAGDLNLTGREGIPAPDVHVRSLP